MIKKLSLTQRVRLSFFWLLILFTTALYHSIAGAESCPTKKIDEYGYVKRVYDGDTLLLSNGKKIRLIGVNTPEMNYDKGAADPYAKEAKDYLTQKVLKKRIGLRYGKDPRDKYKRHLAHIFLENGTNIQAELLRNGYAFNIAIPPNLWQQSCYQALEQQARVNNVGLWRHQHYLPVDARKLTQETLGFSRVKGTIKSVKETKKSIWLNLTDNMALRIDKRDLKYFKSFNASHWQGKNIIAKGWISYRKKRYSMRIKHPAALEVL